MVCRVGVSANVCPSQAGSRQDGGTASAILLAVEATLVITDASPIAADLCRAARRCAPKLEIQTYELLILHTLVSDYRLCFVSEPDHKLLEGFDASFWVSEPSAFRKRLAIR